jgi:photosystem II stability/assembly factor-like uncharacterized protein
MDYLPPVSDPAFRDVSILGVDEPVLGGFDGVDNRPHRELAERDDFLLAKAKGQDELIKLLKAQVDSLNLNSSSAVRTAVLLNWLYGDASPSFELWGAGFSWRDIAPIAITATVAGDDTVDVVSTAGLIQGRTYCIVNPAGVQLETVKVSVILTATRFRAELNLANSLNAQSGAVVARTAAQVLDGYAVFSHGDHFYSRVIDELRAQTSGQLVLRRSADGIGTFAVSYRAAGSEAWALAPLASTASRAANTRDETFTIGIGGRIELRIVYTAPAGNLTATDRVEHMALLPPSRADAASAVSRPSNVSPADQAANVGQTPTLTGSAFLSLYGLAQAGAEFRVSRNPSMSDLVFNSSTDFLAAWLAVSGQSTSFADLVATGPKAFTAIANAVSIRTTDGGLTWATGTVTGDLRRVHADPAANLLAAVGASGAIRTSADLGLSYTTRTPANSYTGTFAGVFVRGAFVTVVGDAGTIQRSINGGAIFNAVTQAAAYAGTFTDLAGDANGNLIAVGSAGEIQTSSNDGQTWTHRNSPGGYAGAYQAVSMDDLGNAVAVGANGAVHTSADYGATWTARAAAGAFAGTFYGVAIRGKRVVVVGTGGEIQTSNDLGATWVKRAAGGGATAQINAVALDANAYGLAVGAAGLVQRTNRVDSATTTYTVPAGTDFLQTNAVYWWQVRYQDTAGAYSPWSVPTAFATMAVFNYVAAPSNLSPAAGDTGVSLLPTLQSSAFAFVGAADTHSRSQWQIASAASFASVFYDSGEVTDLTAHTVASNGLLASQATYFWRVRHKGTNNGYGAWSEPTSFTAQARPSKPAITAPTDGATGVALAPTLTSSAFSMPGGGTHSRSQWQVSQLSSFASVFHDSGDVTSLTAYTLPAGTLALKTTYYARVRHKETGGTYSAWSNVVGFTTIQAAQVADLFNANVRNGTGGVASIYTGVDLTSAGGLIISANRIPPSTIANGPNSIVAVDTVRGIAPLGTNTSILDLTYTNPEQSNADFLGSLTATGFSAGSIASMNGKPYLDLTFKQAPKFFKVVQVNHVAGTADAVDLSSLGTPGFILARSRNFGFAEQVEATWYAWHRGLATGETIPFADGGVKQNNNLLRVNAGTLVLSASLPTGNYMVYGWAHDPDDATGIVKCLSFSTNASGAAAVPTGWGNNAQLALIKRVNGGNIELFDTARSPGFTGQDKSLRFYQGEPEFSSDRLSIGADGILNVQNTQPSSDFIAMFVRAAS